MTTTQAFNGAYDDPANNIYDADQIATVKRRAVKAPVDAPASRASLTWIMRRAPWLLLAGLLLISFITVLTQASRYGISVDEPLQAAYGRSIAGWYHTFGKDTNFLTAFPGAYMPEHGGIVDAVIAIAQNRLPWIDPWLLRHIMTGLIGWLGLIAIALCGYELGGPWVAFAAALGLWLFPRYYGAIYNNPKDIPAAVAMTFTLWATMKLIKHWNERTRIFWSSAILLGFMLGIATAIRVNSLTWYAILAALLAGWWILHGQATWRERRMLQTITRQAMATGLIGVTWLLTTMALWPFIFLNPVGNLIDSIQVLTHYPWNGPVLFNGVQYPATKLPGSYVATWIVISSPPILLALALLGLIIAFRETIERRRIDPMAGAVAMAFAVPMLSFAVLRPVLYDAPRQFLYIFPPLIIFGAYGLVRGVQFLWSQRQAAWRWGAAGLLGVTLVSYALVVADMAALSPYEYIYFSPLVGGLQGASGKYETDYYGVCGKAAIDWLAHNYPAYTHAAAPTLDATYLLQFLIAPYIPAGLHTDYTQPARPDFYISFTRFHEDQRYPGYRVIHVVAAEGVPLCVVKANPATTTGP